MQSITRRNKCAGGLKINTLVRPIPSERQGKAWHAGPINAGNLNVDCSDYSTDDHLADFEHSRINCISC